MCGIAGVVSRTAPIHEQELRLMAAALRHRGPDDDGFYLSPQDRGAHCGFGFRRLSIIDVSGGHQPIPNEDESVWAMCNGEIYNFKELRRELESDGHVFRTYSDTEVLVHLWERDGARLVDRLNGMFAVAIWDERERSLFLARDRLGEKPLYYADLGETMVFASEAKGILAHPTCSSPALDEQALVEYLAFEYVPAPKSIFRGVKKLEAAHTLTWREGKADVERYWEPRFDVVNGRSDAEWIDETAARLRDSVHRRLVSDVPLGVFLSGGLDSSAVAAMMTQLLPPHSVETFSIGFTEPTFDESVYARRVAAYLGTDHHEHIVSARSMASLLPDVVAVLDEPLGDASILPTYELSRLTRRDVTVALGGDGGDELFAGYPTFPAHRVAELYRVPRVLNRALSHAADWLPVSNTNFSIDFKVKRFLRGARAPMAVRDQLWLGSFSPDESRRLVRRSGVDPFSELCNSDGRRSLDLVQRLTAQYLRYYLEGDILVKLDRASMANSLEVRAPFLDHTFVEFVNSMPSSLKLKGLRTKHVLKKALRPYLPPEIIERPKKGFGIPVAEWLNGELKELSDDALSESELRAHGLFEVAEVHRLMRDHRRGRRDNRKQLWTLLMFQLWHRRWLDSTRLGPGFAVGADNVAGVKR